MADYKLTEGGAINTVSGVSFPADPANRHYQEYLLWVSGGGVADPAGEPGPAEVAQQEAARDAPISTRAWFAQNPNARLIWSMPVVELAAEIASLVDVTFPVATAANRLRWKLLITGIALVVRVLVKRERLD